MDSKVFAVILGSLLTVQCYADIYRIENADGYISFSDQPVAGAEKLQQAKQPYRYKVKLDHVIDGDTIKLSDGDKVRLIGINTPEIESRFHQAQAGGEQAKIWLEQHLHSAPIYIEYDEQQRDQYDRLLAHCFLENGEYLNAKLVEQGLATVTLIPPNLRYADKLQLAQKKAEKTGAGMWAMSVYQPRQTEQLRATEKTEGWQRWQGKVKAIVPAEKYVYLTLTDRFRVRIPKANIDLFPTLNSYLNRRIEVRGWLSRHKDQFSMLVQHPSAIILL